MSNKIKGKYGEDIAAKYLIKKGYKIIERNYHFSRYGEVDIIAFDKGQLCFIEVKARTGDKFGAPLEAVTPSKLAKIHKCALSYLPKCPYGFKGFRIDVISILWQDNTMPGEPEITHIKNVEF